MSRESSEKLGLRVSRSSKQAPLTQLGSRSDHQLEYLKAEVVQLQHKLETSEKCAANVAQALHTLKLTTLPTEVQRAYTEIKECVTGILICSSVLTESEVQRCPIPPDFEGLSEFFPWLSTTLNEIQALFISMQLQLESSEETAAEYRDVTV